MLERYTDAQLLEHLKGLGEWSRIRAQELKYFTEHLPEKLAAAAGDRQKEASLRYALSVYVGALQEMVDRTREAQAELDRRAAVKA